MSFKILNVEGTKVNSPSQRPDFNTRGETKNWVDSEALFFREFSWSEQCWKDSEKITKKYLESLKTLKGDVGDILSKGVLIKAPVKVTKVSPNIAINYFRMRSTNKYTLAERQEKQIRDAGYIEQVKSNLGIATLNKDEESGIDSEWVEEWISSFGSAKDQIYLRNRFKAYTSSYQIDGASDQIMLMQILPIEITLFRLNNKICDEKYISTKDDIEQRKNLNTQLQALLSEQKWTKKSAGKQTDTETIFTKFMGQIISEGYVVPDVDVIQDEVDIIIRDIKNCIVDMMS